jgi:hypothetical protein
LRELFILTFSDGRVFSIEKSIFKVTNRTQLQSPVVNLIIRDSRDPIVQEIPILTVHRGIYYLSLSFGFFIYPLTIILVSILCIVIAICSEFLGLGGMMIAGFRL